MAEQNNSHKDHDYSKSVTKTGKPTLMASHNFHPGEIILKEAPLVIGVDKRANKAKAVRVCVGCCCTLTGSGVKSCPNCNWPTCGRMQCWANRSQHAEGECAFLKAAGSLVTEQDTKSTSAEIHYSIMVLRCLSLRQREVTKWNKLMELEYPEAAFKEKGLGVVDETAVVAVVKRWLPSTDISQEIIVKLCRIFFVNSWALQEIQGYRSKGLRGIYYQANSIEHDCVANATSTFTIDGQIEVIAAVAIPKGTKITLNRSFEPLWSTQKRRFVLATTKFLDCYCDRCKDPTELGTFVSGIICPKCPRNQPGFMLPENPLDDDSHWACNKCSIRKTANFIAELLIKVGSDFQGVNRRSVKDCESFIFRNSKILHPHHSYLTEVKMTLCDICIPSGADCTSISAALLKKREDLVKELLKIADVVAPGLSHVRGSLLYHIYFVMRNRIFNLNDNISNSELASRIEAMTKVIDEVIEIYSLEPKESEEGSHSEDLYNYSSQLQVMLGMMRMST